MSPVILVTADRELARVVKSSLRETAAKVTVETASAKAAADALALQPASLVILDLFLPGSSGLDVLKMLKRVNEEGMFVFLTRMRTRTVIERAFRLGAQDVLHWPVSTDILRDTIVRRLENQPAADAEEIAAPGPSKPARKR